MTAEGGYDDASRRPWQHAAPSRRAPMCAVHPSEPACLQCVGCVKAATPARGYHCSQACYMATWPAHRAAHEDSARPGPGEEHDDSIHGNVANGGPGPGGWPTDSGRHSGRSYPPPEEADPPGPRPYSAPEPPPGPLPPPLPRAMVTLAVDGPVHPAGRFSVLTYNVLAEMYATPEMYPQCPPWALAWGWRRQALLREIAGHGADIVCLQEVQSDHFDDFFAPSLQALGYEAIYKRKTSQVYTGPGSYVFDGCATFFKRSRFSLIKKYEVEFNKAALSLCESMAGAEPKRSALKRMLKDNVALIVVLKSLDPVFEPEAGAGPQRPPVLCVANTHIHANPELRDVKLWQVHTLLKGLEKIAASANYNIPMLVTGDFNSVPGSAPHALLATRRVDPAHADLATDPLGILRPASKLTHTLPLESAYAALATARPAPGPAGPAAAAALLDRQRRQVDAAHREPLFTNHSREFVGTLDYLFYSADSLAVSAVLELLDERDVRQGPGGCGLPGPGGPSDHIALLAEFQWRRPPAGSGGR